MVEPVLAFSRHSIDVVDALTGLLPWTSASDQVVQSYDKYLFGKKTLQQLPDTPRFVFCATNLQTGVLWRFSKPYAGDYVVGRIDQPATLVSQAVAASSAFPPVLSPCVLQFPAGSFTSWPGTQVIPPNQIAAYRSKVILTDGGVYDNHGIEPIEKRYLTNFVSDGGAPFGRSAELHTDWISQLRRILDVEDNQVRALRRRDLVARFIAGNKVGDETKLAEPCAYGRLLGHRHRSAQGRSAQSAALRSRSGPRPGACRHPAQRSRRHAVEADHQLGLCGRRPQRPRQLHRAAQRHAAATALSGGQDHGGVTVRLATGATLARAASATHLSRRRNFAMLDFATDIVDDSASSRTTNTPLTPLATTRRCSTPIPMP